MEKYLSVHSLPSNSLVEKANIRFDFGDMILEYDYFLADKYWYSYIRFHSVRAMKFTAELHCNENQLDAESQIIEIVNSNWSRKLLLNENEDTLNHWILNHYMIYLDDNGCFEFLANSWETYTPKLGRLNNN
jgi:hypothetical protein